MQSLLLNRSIQAKLSVSPPDDPLEREADDMAERVMTARVGGGLSVQRKCAACQQEELHRKAGEHAAPEMDGALTSKVDNLRGGGMPLSETTRNFFEPRLGQDFSAVRIHSNAQAAETARSINALAFTRGQDIVFAQGQYQPDSFTGRKLLAHELAHVVQQGGGAQRTPTADTVQRACDEEIYQVGYGCQSLTGGPLPLGELVLFEEGCDKFISTDESRKVKDFADSMLATDHVRVHGFASMDGDAGFNHVLSCARALRVAEKLEFRGIEFEQIEVFEHGPTEGPVDERRSVILELDARETRQPTPQLTATVVVPPTASDCGEFRFDIAWNLSRNSHPRNGGYIIQDITIALVDDDCAGNPIPQGIIRSLQFFEAWGVEPGTKVFHEGDAHGVDQFWMNRDVPTCATGSIQIDAVATYYDDVSNLPPGMKRGNPHTAAHGLRSSLLDPELWRVGVPSRPVLHQLTASWNCCPCRVAPTIIESHTP